MSVVFRFDATMMAKRWRRDSRLCFDRAQVVMQGMVGLVLIVMPSRKVCCVMLMKSAMHALLVRLLVMSNWCNASLTVNTWLVLLVHGVSL